MLLVSREVLFDVMKHKRDIKLSESGSESSAFDTLCSKANAEYKTAMSKSPKSKDVAMDLYANAMLRFMNDNKDDIRFVGQGSSRIVFAMANGTAIKLAKSQAGIAQNWQEAKTCMDPKMKYEIFPDFYGADRSKWLALNCELCAKAHKYDFKEDLFAQPEVIVDVIDFMYKTMGHDPQPLDVKLKKALDYFSSGDGASIVKKLLLKNIIRAQTEAFKALKSLFKFYDTRGPDDLLLGDVAEIDNWGIVERNNEFVPVIIDAGFSEKIYQTFYKTSTAI